MSIVRFFLALAMAGLTTVQAQAQVSYSYATDSTSYTGAVGSTVTVGIYLQETLQGGSNSYVNAQNGLQGAGAGLNVVSTSGGTAAAITGTGQGTFTFATPFVGGLNSAFYNQGTGNNLEFSETTPLAATGGPTNPNGNSTGLIFLGTVGIQVGTGTTTYDLSSLFNDTINGSNSQLGQSNGYTTTFTSPHHDLDVTSAGNYTGANAAGFYSFTVGPAGVPEPSSVILTGLTGALFGFGAWRRRRRQAAEGENAAPVLAMA